MRYRQKPQEFQEIDQSLYSRMMIGGDNKYDISFFNNSIGMYNSAGEMIDRDDTNIQNQNQIPQTFTVKAIRFRETILDMNVREHLLKYSHFTLRLVDRDYITYPIHLMDNYYYFLEKKLEIPIIIHPYMSFQVLLIMKHYDRRFQLTCELLGIMRRPQ